MGEEASEAESRFGLEGEQDLMVESSGRQMRIGEVNDGIEIAVEGVGEGAKGSGFAGADIASDESGETLLKSEGQAALDLLMTT